MAKRRSIPPLEFEDSVEGQVILAMKQAVIEATRCALRVGFDAGVVEVQKHYDTAIKALAEIDKLQDSLIAGEDADEAVA